LILSHFLRKTGAHFSGKCSKACALPAIRGRHRPYRRFTYLPFTLTCACVGDAAYVIALPRAPV
jgi:hypothetical protein